MRTLSIFAVSMVLAGGVVLADGTAQAPSEKMICSSLDYQNHVRKLSKLRLTKEVSVHLAGIVGSCSKDYISAGIETAWSGLSRVLAEKNYDPDLEATLKTCFDHVGKYIDSTNYLIYGTFNPFQ